MKKYFIIIVLFIIITLLNITSFAVSPKLNNININNINLNSIDKSKIEDVKNILTNIDINTLDSAAIINNIDKSEIASGNLNSVDTDDINMNEVVDLYNKLSSVISNKEIANLIKDNSEFLTEAGVSEETLSISETMLRTFDSDAVIDIVQNDLDLNKILAMYNNRFFIRRYFNICFE